MAGHGKNAVVWLGNTNFSGFATSATLSIDIDTVDATTFASSAKEVAEGDYGFMFSFESLFDTTDAGWDETTYDAAITNMGDQYVLFAPTGTAQGQTNVKELVCKWQSRPETGSVGDLWRISGTMVGSGTGSLSRGVVLQNETVTGTGAETGYNQGAVTSGITSVVTYRISSITGTIVLAVEESSDNGSGDAYGAVAAFASGSISSAGLTRKTTTGALEAWRRVNVTTGPTTAAVLVTHTVAPN